MCNPSLLHTAILLRSVELNFTSVTVNFTKTFQTLVDILLLSHVDVVFLCRNVTV